MKKVGCFVRNDYKTNETKNSGAKHKHSTNLIDCATECHLNDSCTEGWTYQIATKQCYFNSEVIIEKLQPGSSILPHEHTIGWATGLKSCSRIDSDGKWSKW